MVVTITYLWADAIIHVRISALREHCRYIMHFQPHMMTETVWEEGNRGACLIDILLGAVVEDP